MRGFNPDVPWQIFKKINGVITDIPWTPLLKKILKIKHKNILKNVGFNLILLKEDLKKILFCDRQFQFLKNTIQTYQLAATSSAKSPL